jgi:hypothetical protein
MQCRYIEKNYDLSSVTDIKMSCDYQVRVLKQRVMVLEDESSVRPLPLSSAPSETSL